MKTKPKKANKKSVGDKAARRRLDALVRRPALQSLDAITGNLYEAVARYVEAGGGNVVVVGGIETQQWPHDPKGKFRIAISFLGRAPEYGGPSNAELSDRASKT